MTFRVDLFISRIDWMMYRVDGWFICRADRCMFMIDRQKDEYLQ